MALLIEVFIVISITVSFLVFGSSLKHLCKHESLELSEIYLSVWRVLRLLLTPWVVGDSLTFVDVESLSFLLILLVFVDSLSCWDAVLRHVMNMTVATNPSLCSSWCTSGDEKPTLPFCVFSCFQQGMAFWRTWPAQSLANDPLLTAGYG